ncbi:MAG: hypothetical protein AEth_01873 [Candidatus Argoarchaeum ethanivorans]|uniref:Uncharacterized protein n=1 Tax=Candidatus Argoarchaeum ethanivorans TaxID=2608793 RepID=A0A8B3RZ74_9EURY|nr:MAG: hypothetical protein AEth_01873 [Candidatus Argoarchaeum ethanivorans]
MGLVTDEDSTKWEPDWTDNFVWSLSHNGASAILASGSYCRSQNWKYAYATKVYNDFYKYLYEKESETTTPIGEALKEAERNYDVDEAWNPFNAGLHKKARVQFILYSIPWMTFDPPINPPEPINKGYNVTFTAPEKLDEGVYKRLITIEITDYNLTSVEGFDLITIEGASYILNDFKPILPKINTDIYLPIQSEIENITITLESEIGLGDLNVPSFQSTIASDPPNSSFTNISDITGVFPTPRFISTNITYPEYNKIRINLAPVQYNIDTNETVLFNKTVLEIIYNTTDDLIVTDFLSLNNKFNINNVISTNVTVENVGSETIENVHYEFTIKDSFSTIVKNHSSSEFNIPMGIQQFEANVSTQDLQQGSYLAEINILNNTGYILANSSEYIYLISGEITNFTINTTGIEQGGDLKLNFEFENYNDADVTFNGQISISDSQNNIADTLLIPLTIASGDNTKQFSYIWNSGNNSPGCYKAELTLSSEGSDYGSEDQWFTISNSPSTNAWHLHNDSIMYRTATNPTGNLTIATGSSNLWIADEPAQTNLTFPPGVWTGRITLETALASGQNFSIEIGNCSGGNFTGSGSAAINGDGNTSFDFQITANSFNIAKDDYLAINITDTTTGIEVKTGGTYSHIILLDTAPTYPVPELPSVVLVSTALIMLVGIFLINSRRSGKK